MVRPRELPSQAELLEVLRYDAETGDLFWIKRGHKHGHRKKESLAGTRSTDGYRTVTWKGRPLRAHRLIWVIVNGQIPEGLTIDHADGDRLNNRLANLRCVTPTENQQNKRLDKRNKSSCPGVCWSAKHGRWEVTISRDRKQKTLGRFVVLEEAIRARKSAEVEYGYHPNHGRQVASVACVEIA